MYSLLFTSVTHASPAGVFAHSADRDWESNADVRASNCNDIQIDDITEQLVYGETGRHLKVIFGGGRENFLNETAFDQQGSPGRRTDGKNLIDEWLKHGQNDEQRHFVYNKVRQNESFISFIIGEFIEKIRILL